jgi:hypothetical protein
MGAAPVLGGIWEIVSRAYSPGLDSPPGVVPGVGRADAVGSREGRSGADAAAFIAAVQTDVVPPGLHAPEGWRFVTYSDNRLSREIQYRFARFVSAVPLRSQPHITG